MEPALSFTASGRLQAPASFHQRRQLQTFREGPLMEMLRRQPTTREEVHNLQIAMVILVASELKKDLPANLEREVELAEERAKSPPKGVWPKAEFLASLGVEPFFKALRQFEALETMVKAAA